MGKDD